MARLPRCLIRIAIVTAFSLLAARPARVSAQTPPAPDKAGARFKNLRVFQDLPQEQFFATMAFMAGSLGVKCEFCHNEGDFASDEKPQKQTARKMVLMTREINERFLHDGLQVTCNACHRGGTRPVTMPDPEQAFWRSKPKPAHAPAQPPSPAEMLARYRRVTGSAAAGPNSVTATITDHIINGSGPPVDRTARVYYAGSDRMRVELQRPDGVSILAFNGAEGWLKTPTSTVPARRADLMEFISLLLPDQARVTGEMSAKGSEVVDGRVLDVAEGTEASGRRVLLYFDRPTGLLTRRRVFFDTAFGPGPFDTDYRDYEKAGTQRVPRTFEIKSLASHFLRTVANRRVDAVLPSSFFERP